MDEGRPRLLVPGRRRNFLEEHTILLGHKFRLKYKYKYIAQHTRRTRHMGIGDFMDVNE